MIGQVHLLVYIYVCMYVWMYVCIQMYVCMLLLIYECAHAYIYIYISYNTVVLYSRDRYEIIGFRKSSHSIKQPCSSIYLKKAFAMHQSC